VTDFDFARMDRILPAIAGPADWDDVLGRLQAQRARRRRVAIVLAIAALAVVVTTSALAVRAIVLSSGPTELPFAGATPSMPENGRLVVNYDGRPELRGFPDVFVPVYQVWVYADGRVIWRQEDGPSGVSGLATGYLERRLSPKGVELVRSKLLSTGLFDRDLFLRSEHGLVGGTIRVQNGGRLVGAFWAGYWGHIPPEFPKVLPDATATQASVLSRLTEELADLSAWLPKSAWKDPELRSFVPSRYAICYTRSRYWSNPQLLQPHRVLSLLPTEARGLLRGRDRTYHPVSLVGYAFECSEVELREALRLAEIFRREGYDADPLPPNSPPNPALNIRFRAPAINTAFAFEPVLPHGQWEPMGG
jgi:hypothetical protein